MWAARFAFIGSLAGVFVTYALTFSRAVGSHLSCGEKDDCGKVAASALAMIGPIPTSVFGLVAFFVLAVLSARFLERAEPGVRNIAFAFAALCAAINLGFSAYAQFVVHAHCIWCLIANLLYGIVALCLSSTNFEEPLSRFDAMRWQIWPGITLFLAASIYGISIIPKGLLDSKSPLFSLIGSRDGNEAAISKIDASELASARSIQTGSSDASGVTLVIFVDLECHYSRDALRSAFSELENHDFKMIIRHHPLRSHGSARELARMAEQLKPNGNAIEFLRRLCESSYELDDASAIAARLKRDSSAPTGQIETDEAVGKAIGVHEVPFALLMKTGEPTEFSTDALKLLHRVKWPEVKTP